MTGNVEYDVRRMFKHACAFATSAVFRSKVLTLVVSVDEEQDWIFHVDFLEDLDSAFDVPQDWTGLYFPSDLPDGYVISMTDSTRPVSSIKILWGRISATPSMMRPTA